MMKTTFETRGTPSSDHETVMNGAASASVPDERRHSGALPLQVWLSPSFPVGSFAFSHGIEWAVQAGDVSDVATTAAWIAALLEFGSLRNDVIFASCAWRAVAMNDSAELASIADLALAMAGSHERWTETTAQGNAFSSAIRSAWSTPAVEAAYQALRTDVAYPVAVAIAAAAHDIPRRVMLEMFSLALVQNLVSATIRLSVLGHSDGQRVIAALLPIALQLASIAQNATLDDLGASAFRSDIASMKHETQYTRLFRT